MLLLVGLIVGGVNGHCLGVSGKSCVVNAFAASLSEEIHLSIPLVSVSFFPHGIVPISSSISSLIPSG